MTVASRARASIARGFRRLASAAGQDLVPRNFYSPIPSLEDLPSDVLERRGALRGIRYEPDAHLAYLSALSPFLEEFDPPPGFEWGNGMYDRVEADVLYAIVRHEKPKRIVELGSGFSSLLIAQAATRNADEGHPASYAAYDPFAREFVREGIPGLELTEISAADVPLETFASLDAGDILFVDTTHTVKLGSEVNYIVLDVLPTLKAGVSVHVHDVFLPYEYPRSFFEKRLYWSEQYLLQAFLAQNPHWEVLLPLAALVREQPDAVAELVRSYRAGVGPGAFWIRSVA